MDANHKKRLNELKKKGELSATEEKELKGLKAYEAECKKKPAKAKVEEKEDEPKAEEKKKK